MRREKISSVGKSQIKEITWEIYALSTLTGIRCWGRTCLERERWAVSLSKGGVTDEVGHDTSELVLIYRGRLGWTFSCWRAFAFSAWDSRYSNTANTTFFFFLGFLACQEWSGTVQPYMWTFSCEQYICALFTDLQISLFIIFFY